ncbi:MAG TPA: alpha/beta fold hydrolase [Polyangiaceae bacterium]|nr:alpha/beta fold hydrolase [Polyangiaceae bacterium]
MFEPAGTHRGTVLVHGATATPQRYYAPFAAALATHGFRMVTYDYRGIGASRPTSLGGLSATMTDWALKDARAMHRYVAGELGEDRVAIIGHSFGGQLLGLVDEARDVAGALLVGAQFGYVGNFPAPRRYGLGLVLRAVPLFTAAFGFLPGETGIGEDLPRGVAEEWSRWCLTEDYYVTEHPDALGRLAGYDRPVRLYRFTDDAFAPRRAVEALTSRLGTTTDVRRVSPRDHGGRPIGHFGFFRPRFRKTLWQESTDYLGAILAGRTPRPGAGRLGIEEADVLADLTRHGWG